MKSTVGIKTVYVVGAGFSYEGGFPLQRQILERIFKEDYFNILTGDRDNFIRLSALLADKQRILKEFLNKVFASASPSLEDVFTLLDQTISRRENCLGYSWLDLNNIRDALKSAILIILHDIADRKERKKFYKEFSAFLIKSRAQAKLKNDLFSVISLNWDTLIEDSIYQWLHACGFSNKIDIDYCCYTTPLGKKCPHTPSLLQKAKKIYNIKIMKLHGSTNWLYCPNCSRMYTGVGSTEKIWDLYTYPRSCINCVKLSGLPSHFPQLEPFFITPTFTKVFDNAHIQMTWHNAQMDLSEAEKIVFIGYSLPETDYHFKTLMRRAIRPNTPIEVVLTKYDNPKKTTEERHKDFYATTRYRDFFRSHPIKFYLNGAENYFRGKIPSNPSNSRLKAWVKP